MKLNKLFALLLALGLIAAACGDGDTDTVAADDGIDDTTAPADDTTAPADDTTAPADETATTTCDPLPTKVDGVLTVATGEPVFQPWIYDDDPESEQGFEAGLVYALADQLGVGEVAWVRTGFDEAVAPGEKDYDFNIQQYSITPEREEVVDFSDGYYEVEQAIIGRSDSPLASAESLEDLVDSQLGAAIGTTSLDYIEDTIEPSSIALVFGDNAAAKSAFDAGQVDAIVFDLPTAYYITAVEITDASIIGVLPRSGEPEELGMLFEDGSALTGCVNEALAALKADGTVEALEDEFLNQGGSIPSLAN